MKQETKHKIFAALVQGNRFIFGTIGRFTRKELLWFEKTLQRFMFGKSVSVNVWLDLEKELK